jgi:tetratricopeptide (TPR) repeat protein
VLVGTVRRSENQLQVAVQLNSAENGYHLWSGSYERDSANIGTIAPEIASAVTNVLGAGLTRRSGQNVRRVLVSQNSGAHENYLRGLFFRNRYTVDSLNKAIEYFKQAIAEDPAFAEAYAGLADCYAMARPVASTPPLEVVSKIRAAASKAIELDGTLGEPHIDLAVSAEYEYDWATAEKEFKKGLELSPSDVVGHLWYAWYLALVGRKDEVLAERTIAARLDPVSPSAVESLGDYYSAVGHFDAAVEQFHSALALEPNFGPAHEDLGEAYLAQGKCGNAIEELRLANEAMPGPRRLGDLGYGYAICGHTAEAQRILRDFLNAPQRRPIPAFAIAQVYMGLGDKDRAFRWLEKAIDERDLGMGLNWDACFHSLRSDPRFGGLLRRMKLA